MSCGVLSASWSWAVDGSSPATLQVSGDARPIEASVQLPELVPATGREAVTTPNTLQFIGTPTNAVASSAASSGTVLRWRGRTPTGETAAAPRVATGAWQDRATKTRGVRIVSHDEQGDAFRDPFEDRLAQVVGPKAPAAKKSLATRPGQPKLEAPDLRTAPAQPAEAETPRMDSSFPAPAAPATELMPSESAAPALDAPGPATAPTEPQWKAPTAPATVETPPAASESLPAAAPPGDSPAPVLPPLATPAKPLANIDAPPPPPFATPAPAAGMPAAPVPPPARTETQPMPKWGSSAAAADKQLPCDRVYNFRNCCQEDKNCNNARTAVKNASIRKVSLDITPSTRPDLDTPQAQKEALQAQLKQMPARTWKDRSGAVVAEGQLTDIRNRRITVTQPNGQSAVVPLGDLSDDDLCFLTAWWGVPSECTLGDDQFAGRSWESLTVNWKASGLCHKPLYFEQVQLERYGHTVGPLLESPLAGAHFFANMALLPYNMGIHPPQECQYALGYYRPGNCAPWLLPPFPLSVRGAVAEASVIVGGVLLIP